MRLVTLLVFWVTLLFPMLLLADEGHVHKDTKPLVMPDKIVVQETATDAIELVLKHLMFEPGKPTLARVFLSTADENKPIAHATVEFEFAELGELKIIFAPEKDHPGVYSANMSLPKSGTFDATVSVSGDNISDLLTLPGIETKPALTSGGPSQISHTYLWAALILLLVVALVAVITIRRRKHV